MGVSWLVLFTELDTIQQSIHGCFIAGATHSMPANDLYDSHTSSGHRSLHTTQPPFTLIRYKHQLTTTLTVTNLYI
jgi:hypothetical protein